jgi:hypothetical protein
LLAGILPGAVAVVENASGSSLEFSFKAVAAAAAGAVTFSTVALLL